MKTNRPTFTRDFALSLSLCLIGGFGLVGCQNTAEGMKEDANKNGAAVENSAQNAADKTKEATANAGDALTLTPKVKSAIVADAKLNDPKNLIDVDTKDGVVYLKGHVLTNDQKKLAGDIAAKTVTESGSKDKVMNQLTVEAH